MCKPDAIANNFNEQQQKKCVHSAKVNHRERLPPFVRVRMGFIKRVIVDQGSEGWIEVQQLNKGVGMKDIQSGSSLWEWSRAQFWCQVDWLWVFILITHYLSYIIHASVSPICKIRLSKYPFPKGIGTRLAQWLAQSVSSADVSFY